MAELYVEWPCSINPKVRHTVRLALSSLDWLDAFVPVDDVSGRRVELRPWSVIKPPDRMSSSW
jgi:hypothetical protein